MKNASDKNEMVREMAIELVLPTVAYLTVSLGLIYGVFALFAHAAGY